ncbi:MAG: 30S ribosomal protein S12 methylthiotransferase RimO [candidate division WOR-3 bacterium]|nr:30S ribosomal protein S12 methylthiotransferase RimO [candidate division WOR-3 bacterium]
MVKAYFISLGCPKNLVDTEKIMGILGKNGVTLVQHLKDSDIIVINTCGFIKPALKETETEIKRLLPHKEKIFVYGCAVNRAGEQLRKKFPDIKRWYHIDERSRLIKDIINKNPETDARVLSTIGYAYLKIADGCSNHCSYCTIPSIKGEYKSADFTSLIAEARALIKLGIKEIILIAQDTARYGLDLYDKKMIVPLIRQISRIKGIEWIRLLYVHPCSLDDELISEIKHNPRVCKYLEIPLQHINDRILKLMNRNITKKEIIMKLEKLKGITLRTTVIVGFPTETEEEFEELYDFLSAGYFDWFGVFKYQREKGTPAWSLKPLSPTTVNERFLKMIKLQQRLIKNKNRARLNKVFKVLVHRKNKYFIGHTEFSAPEIDGQVIIKTNNIVQGNFYMCKIRRTKGVDLCAW